MEINKTTQNIGICKKTKYPETEGLKHNRYANVLNREFYAEQPMQKIVTDVTYIKHKAKWNYVKCSPISSISEHFVICRQGR